MNVFQNKIMQNNRKDIRTLTFEELEDFFIKNSEKKFRVKQVYEWLWKKPVASFDDMSNISKATRELLKQHFDIFRIKTNSSYISIDGTIKTAFELHDGKLIEGVYIPSENTKTACISTQVGCAMNCKFCATASLGFDRNLLAWEIYDQVVEINKQSILETEMPLSNIVIMGMGEPLLNYDNVIRAIHFITHKDGLGMSPRRITLSTVGVPNMIQKMADDKVRFNLAVSLHSANDEKRTKMIPANKKMPIEKLSEALKYFTTKTNSIVTIEYILFKGINDSIADLKALIRFCSDFHCKVNLIEYNNTDNMEFKKSEESAKNLFIEYLENKNIVVNLRKSRGQDINAACGQLANKIKTRNHSINE